MGTAAVAPWSGAAVGAMVLGTVAFGGIGLLLAGTLKPLVNLAVVNALFVVLLLLGGMLIPLGNCRAGWPRCPECCRPRPWPTPSTTPWARTAVSVHDWIVLVVWAVRPRRWPPGSPSAGSEAGELATGLARRVRWRLGRSGTELVDPDCIPGR